jgi:hypothetical protein
MLVRNKLRLRVGAARVRRGLLMGSLAAALAWCFPGHLSTAQPVAMIAVSLVLVLGLWLTFLRKPSPRCPRCAHRVTLRRGLKACPTCNVSLDAEVQPEWSRIPGTQSPWITRPGTLRMG